MASAFTDQGHRRGVAGVKVLTEMEVAELAGVIVVVGRRRQGESVPLTARQLLLNHSYFLTPESFFLTTAP